MTGWILRRLQINSAIGLEILLNIFVSKSNGKLGQADETYEIDYATIMPVLHEMKPVLLETTTTL